MPSRRLLARMLVATLVARASVASATPHRPHRPVPDYDGRGTATAPVRPSAWVVLARGVLAPLYAIVQYGLRLPLGLAVPALERAHVASQFQRSSTDRTPGLSVAPTLVLDVGFITAFGATVHWYAAFTPRNDLALRLATGGSQTWDLRLWDHLAVGDHVAFELSTAYRERADWTFHGLGAHASRDAQRFDWGRFDTRFASSFAFGHHVAIDVWAGVRLDRFDAPSLTDQGAPVPGDDNHTSMYGAGSFALDTRPAARAASTGARLAGWAEVAADVRAPRDRVWVAWQVDAGVFIEVKRPGRMIALRSSAAFADPLSTLPVPFVDQATLGGFDSLRAFRWGRFRGESSFVAAVEYRYPVWYLLDGTVFAEVGNAFAHHLSDFSPALLHGSFGLGFRSAGSRDRSVDLVFALGTSRFDEPFAIESARLAIGLNHGF